MKRFAAVFALLVLLACVSTTARAASDRVWFGGGVGLSFGTVDYIEVSPLVGYRLTDDVSLGGGLFYRYRSDGRYSPSLDTSDYGANVFGRYRVAPPVFLQVEYEYLDYEYARIGGSTDRETFDSVLAGAGFVQPAGGRASLFVLGLYNFSYDDNDLRSPYSDPWVFRVGVSIGF
jgi:hypothetical protein